MAAAPASNVTPIKPKPELDLILKGGRVVDPATGTDGILDVGIVGDRIVEIAPDIAPARAKAVRSVAGRLVLPGLIDTHAHCYTHVSGPFGLSPEDIGVRAGVATVVDQGGASPLTMGGFKHFVADPAATRTLSFVSTYLVGGLYGHRYVNLYGPHGIDIPAIVKAVETYPDLIRGIKSHAEPGNYSRWGVEVLKLSKQAGVATKLPIYIHLGTLWPEKDGKPVDTKQLLDEVLPLMGENDILAHPFSRHPSGFVGPDGKVHPLVFEAVKRGVKIDVGRGSHFSFDIAKRVVDAGIVPDTLGGDLHGYNTNKLTFYNLAGQFRDDEDPGAMTEDGTKVGPTIEPTFSLHHAMTEMLAIGVPFLDVIKSVTSNAAAMLRMEDTLGSLQPGRMADISVVEMESGDFELFDGSGKAEKGHHRFKPDFMLRAGVIHEPISELLPRWERKAA